MSDPVPTPRSGDTTYAATTRFGRPTAGGPHATSLLLALTASHFSKKGSDAGLGVLDRIQASNLCG